MADKVIVIAMAGVGAYLFWKSQQRQQPPPPHFSSTAVWDATDPSAPRIMNGKTYHPGYQLTVRDDNTGQVVSVEHVGPSYGAAGPFLDIHGYSMLTPPMRSQDPPRLPPGEGMREPTIEYM